MPAFGRKNRVIQKREPGTAYKRLYRVLSIIKKTYFALSAQMMVEVIPHRMPPMIKTITDVFQLWKQNPATR